MNERYRAELPVTDRTIYSYIDAGLLDARNIDLRRELRRPERKKSGSVLRVDRKCHMGRTYEKLIRYVIPKNQAKERYTKEEIREMMNHINSYPRKKWNGQAPIDLFVKIYGQEAAERLGLEKIPSDSIHLTPALLKK